MSDNSLKQRYEMLNEMYKQTPEPALRSILKSALDVIGRKVSEEEPADNTPADNTPAQTPQGRNIATAISSNDDFETKGDNLEPGASADNPIDSKTLTFEAQAQLPIGTWVTTSKGPHRINQGDRNWAKQQMQKTAQPPKASSADKPADIPQEDEVQAELEGAPRVFSEDKNNWALNRVAMARKAGDGTTTSTTAYLPENVKTYGDLLRLKDDYEKAYQEALQNYATENAADEYAARQTGLKVRTSGRKYIDYAIKLAKSAMADEKSKTVKRNAKFAKDNQKRIYAESPEGQAAAQKAREDAATRAAERAERNADRHDR